MTDIPRKTIERSLSEKGFKLLKSKKGKGVNAGHRWYAFYYKGKEYRHISAMISHAPNYKTYDKTLLIKMRTRLHLDRLQDVRGLLSCPMGKQEYLAILINKQIVEA
jgi:hypothetical protein